MLLGDIKKELFPLRSNSDGVFNRCNKLNIFTKKKYDIKHKIKNFYQGLKTINEILYIYGIYIL